VLVAPDGVTDLDYLLVAVALLLDLASWTSGGGYGSRRGG
jgi:hypothetical protein